ncbi:MAG: hypothetical protein R3B47_20920 [Bacteroidia bacterium]
MRELNIDLPAVKNARSVLIQRTEGNARIILHAGEEKFVSGQPSSIIPPDKKITFCYFDGNTEGILVLCSVWETMFLL